MSDVPAARPQHALEASHDAERGGAPEPPQPAEPSAAPPAPVDRRSFFRAFSRQTVSTVVQVAGMAGAVQRGATSAMVNAVGIGLGDPTQTAARMTARDAGTDDVTDTDAVAAAAAANGPRFRSPYRVTDGVIYLLDQRLLPERTEEIPCRRAADVAFQMRMLAVNGAPLLAQLAAYGYALTAAEARDWVAGRRQAEFRRATQLLTYARPAAHPVRVALARLESRVAALAKPGEPETDGQAIATATMAEADAIATQAAIDHAAIARATAALLQADGRTAVRVLVVGDPGLLTTGQVGTGIAALQLLAQSGMELKVFVAEGRPRLEGARLASWELRLAGIEHTVIGDSAIAWLLSSEPLDAVLMGADWIAADGDTVATIGSRAVAELAAAGLNAGRATPVYVLAPTVTIASEPFSSGAVPVENRPGRELAPELAAAGHRGTNLANPGVEVIPGERISAFITERGVHRPPFSASLPALEPSVA